MAQDLDSLTRHIQTFDGRIEPHTMSIFYAKRYSGKSYLMKALAMYNRKQFDGIIVVSGTAFTGFWDDLDAVVHDKYSPLLLQRAMTAQESKKRFKNLLIILDDIISDADMRNDTVINALATKGRHYNITVMLATQNATSIAPVIRRNSDYVFIFKQFNQPMLDTLAEDYCIYPLQKKDFKALIQGSLTDDFGAIVIKLRVQSTSDLSKIYMTYRAKGHRTSGRA